MPLPVFPLMVQFVIVGEEEDQQEMPVPVFPLMVQFVIVGEEDEQ